MHLLVDEKEDSATTPVYLLPYSDPVKILGLVQCMNIVISLVDSATIIDVSELTD